MNVLVLHQHYWPEIAPTGQLLQDVCEDLAREGHRITVVCGQPSYRHVAGVARVVPGREVVNGVQVLRVWSYIPERRGIPLRLLNYGSYFSTSLVEALRGPRPDVMLIMSSPPLLLGISAELVRHFRDVPFVYSVQDIYPDVAASLGVLRPGLAYNLIDLIGSRLYRGAAQLVTLSNSMADRLSLKGVRRERIVVIPNWADTREIQPLPRDNDFAREHGLAGRFVFLYSGNVGLSQGLEHVVMAASKLRDLPITVAIAGDGNARDQLGKLVLSERIENVVFVPPQRRAVLPQLLASCDVGLVSTRGAVTSELVPSKLYGILAAGRPVLAAVEPGSEVARVLRQHDCGTVVPPENAEALAGAMRTMFHDRARIAEQGQRGRLVCERSYSRTACTERYGAVLQSAMQTAQRSSDRSWSERAGE